MFFIKSITYLVDSLNICLECRTVTVVDCQLHSWLVSFQGTHWTVHSYTCTSKQKSPWKNHPFRFMQTINTSTPSACLNQKSSTFCGVLTTQNHSFNILLISENIELDSVTKVWNIAENKQAVEPSWPDFPNAPFDQRHLRPV